jgi:hypothetical protein
MAATLITSFLLKAFIDLEFIARDQGQENQAV